jgi:hypothetical protein
MICCVALGVLVVLVFLLLSVSFVVGWERVTVPPPASSFPQRRIMHTVVSLRAALCLALLSAIPFVSPAQTDSTWLVRRYRPGEKLLYRMTATNKGKDRVTHYEAQATGQVKKDSAGTLFEEYAWSNLRINDQYVTLPPASVRFRQRLSLVPSYRLAIPDLHRLHPGLVGPVVDLLTFYADVQLAMREQGLAQSGDHAYVNDGNPNSWADGGRILTGEDAIDFDITLADVDLTDSVVTLVVRHVPPARPAITLKAPWMRVPVGGTPNNWVQVSRGDSGGFVASVGKETFDASIRLSLADGKVLTATLDNQVDVLERECRDSSLTLCNDPVRYQIRRRIEIY